MRYNKTYQNSKVTRAPSVTLRVPPSSRRKAFLLTSLYQKSAEETIPLPKICACQFSVRTTEKALGIVLYASGLCRVFFSCRRAVRRVSLSVGGPGYRQLCVTVSTAHRAGAVAVEAGGQPSFRAADAMYISAHARRVKVHFLPFGALCVR